MSNLFNEFLTTKELAELLRIKERKVYDLAAAGDVPCSRATGKLLFPRAAIDAWVASKSAVTATTIASIGVRPSVFLGSHDPLLDWALRESEAGMATFFDGSADGLDRFADGEGVAAGSHLYVPDLDEWNIPLIKSRFSNMPVVLVEFAWRERGLIFDRDKDLEIEDINSLKGRIVVPRQSGAGSQVLLEHLLDQAELYELDITYAAPARTETDAALAVLEGKADVAFGLQGVAYQYRLHFLPIMRERYDLLVDRRAWFDPPMQRFLRFCASPSFARKAQEFMGYDVSGFGTVHFNGD